jgi:hypothetical protein
MRSLARAVVAMTHPAVGTPDVYRLVGWTAEARVWAADAEPWLAPLRDQEPAGRPLTGRPGSAQSPGRGR